MLTRRYDFMCKNKTCYYLASGKKQTCTDCAAAAVAEARDQCQWDHGVFMLDLTMKIKLREKGV